LQRDILKGQWGFTGLVVSDWGSIGEMVQHGFVADDKAAARAAITAGSDLDMESNAYRQHLAELVTEGAVDLALVDDAVRRVLRKKFELGLFEGPYRYSNEAVKGHAGAANTASGACAGGAASAAQAHAGVAAVGPAQDGGLCPDAGEGRERQPRRLGSDLPDVDYSQFFVTQWSGLRQALPATTKLLCPGLRRRCEHRRGCPSGFHRAEWWW
jgi:beta-glucosidase